jgi:hypothetical protein
VCPCGQIVTGSGTFGFGRAGFVMDCDSNLGRLKFESATVESDLNQISTLGSFLRVNRSLYDRGAIGSPRSSDISSYELEPDALASGARCCLLPCWEQGC